MGSHGTTCTGAAQVSPALCQNPKPTSMPDADMVYLLARVEADPCTQPLVSDGNNAGLPSSQALLTPAVNTKGLGERKERSTPACRQDKASVTAARQQTHEL